ncbi:4159_t:CDS:2, partial [Cetraspora pellucida]
TPEFVVKKLINRFGRFEIIPASSFIFDGRVVEEIHIEIRDNNGGAKFSREGSTALMIENHFDSIQIDNSSSRNPVEIIQQIWDGREGNSQLKSLIEKYKVKEE